jgi:arylformamidase
MQPPLLDVSVSLNENTTVWPGDPSLTRQPVCTLDKDGCAVTGLSLSTHTGTHLDAPRHFFKDGAPIDHLPTDLMVGPCRVLEVTSEELIEAADLQEEDLLGVERLLFKTRNSRRRWMEEPFDPDFVALSPDAARLLVKAGVRLIGIDALSIGRSDEAGMEVHRILLGAGVWILEAIDLSRIKPGPYELHCLPLKIQGGDGAPARVLLRPRK